MIPLALRHSTKGANTTGLTQIGFLLNPNSLQYGECIAHLRTLYDTYCQKITTDHKARAVLPTVARAGLFIKSLLVVVADYQGEDYMKIAQPQDIRMVSSGL